MTPNDPNDSRTCCDISLPYVSMSLPYNKPVFRYYKNFVEKGAKRLGLGARVLDMEEESPVGWQRVTDVGATEKEYFFNSFEHNSGGLGCYWHDLFSAVRTVRLLDHHTTHYDIFNDTSFRRAMRQWRRNARRRNRHQLLRHIDQSVCMLETGERASGEIERHRAATRLWEIAAQRTAEEPKPLN